jgi:hypothetical protein
MSASVFQSCDIAIDVTGPGKADLLHAIDETGSIAAIRCFQGIRPSTGLCPHAGPRDLAKCFISDHPGSAAAWEDSMPEPVRPGRVAILWRDDEAARRSVLAETSRFAAIFAALAALGIDAEPVVYQDDVRDAVRAQLAAVDGVLVWVNPIHERRNRANLDALLREVAARGVWVSAHPDVILKMGTKEVLHRTRTMSWGCDMALYRTAEAMRAELPGRLAAGPRVIKRNRGNGGQGVWKVETLASPRNRSMVRVLDATRDASEEMALDDFLERCIE